MSRPKTIAIIAVAVLFGSAATGLLVSKIYWGYWYEPPPLQMISRIKSVESFSAVWPSYALGSQPMAGTAAFKAGVKYGVEDDPSFPLGRVPVALAMRGLSPVREDGSAERYFNSALRQLEQRGMLESGKFRYRFARKFESAYLATAVTREGSRILLLATHGGEVSNDHYPYYEAAFRIGDGGVLQPLEVHRFFYDVAGVEGMNAVNASIAAAIPLTALGLFAFGLVCGLRAA